MKTIRVTARALRARDHLLRLALGVGLAGVGAALWLADVARTLAG